MPVSRPSPRLAAALALLAALAATALLRTAPVAPRGTDAPPAEFSAARALATVRDLAGVGEPRWTGSPPDVRAVSLLAARLRDLGLETDVQETFACGPYGVCAPVRNVLARLGRPGRKAVLLVAHHDSVPAGPGVSDDLSGAAIVLEVARALAAGPPLARPFVAVITDAEEAGLVGASAFAGRHPWAADAGSAVNLEARGTSGPSILFDTGGDPAWIARVARRMRRPVTTSLAPAIYDLLPNDTDLTVLERHGMQGANLAFAVGVVRYHTPLDDLSHLDLRSLQHQGENALALVRALSEEDLEVPRRASLVFFDVLGLGVAAYGRPLAVAAVALLLVAAAAWRLLRREPRPVGALLWGLAAAAAGPLLAAGLLLLAWLALPGALPRPFVASPGPIAAAAWAGGAGAALLAAAAAAPRAGGAGLFAGAAALHALLGVALAAALPGASHVGALPALAAGAAGLGWALAPRGREGWAAAAAVAPAATAAVVLFPVCHLLPHVLGVPAAGAVAALVALAVLPLAPLGAGAAGAARWAPGAAGVGLALVLAGVQAALPHATEDSPERMSIGFHEEAGQARWLVETEHDALPPRLRGLAGFSSRRVTPFAWAPRRASFSAPAAPAFLPPPRLEVLSAREAGGVRRVRARLSSPRGAPIVLVVFPPGAEVVSFAMEGVPAPAPAARAGRRWGGHRIHACAATPPGGVEIEVALRGGSPVPVVLVDQSGGLPPGGERLVAARPRTAVPSQEGDATFVTARAAL
jgi:hypothetical protein